MIISRCNFVNSIKLTNAQTRNAKDFMGSQKVIQSKEFSKLKKLLITSILDSAL